MCFWLSFLLQCHIDLARLLPQPQQEWLQAEMREVTVREASAIILDGPFCSSVLRCAGRSKPSQGSRRRSWAGGAHFAMPAMFDEDVVPLSAFSCRIAMWIAYYCLRQISLLTA